MEHPEIIGKLKSSSQEYGTINIKPDGSFSGKIEDPYIHVMIVEFLKIGLADGLTLTTNNVPAVPLREFKTEPIPPSIASRQLKVYSDLARDVFDLHNSDWDGS